MNYLTVLAIFLYIFNYSPAITSAINDDDPLSHTSMSVRQYGKFIFNYEALTFSDLPNSTFWADVQFFSYDQVKHYTNEAKSLQLEWTQAQKTSSAKSSATSNEEALSILKELPTTLTFIFYLLTIKPVLIEVREDKNQDLFHFADKMQKEGIDQRINIPTTIKNANKLFSFLRNERRKTVSLGSVYSTDTHFSSKTVGIQGHIFNFLQNYAGAAYENFGTKALQTPGLNADVYRIFQGYAGSFYQYLDKKTSRTSEMRRHFLQSPSIGIVVTPFGNFYDLLVREIKSFQDELKLTQHF